MPVRSINGGDALAGTGNGKPKAVCITSAPEAANGRASTNSQPNAQQRVSVLGGLISVGELGLGRIFSAHAPAITPAFCTALKHLTETPNRGQCA